MCTPIFQWSPSLGLLSSRGVPVCAPIFQRSNGVHSYRPEEREGEGEGFDLRRELQQGIDVCTVGWVKKSTNGIFTKPLGFLTAFRHP